MFWRIQNNREKTRRGGYSQYTPDGAVALNENTETAEEKDR